MISYHPQKIILTGDAAVAFCADEVLARVDYIRSHLISCLETIYGHVRNTNIEHGTHDCLTSDGLLDEFGQIHEDFEKQLSGINTTLRGVAMLCCEADKKE